LLAGGEPAATYLFCFAKKGRPKKATARLALRVLTLRFSTICAAQKMGRVLNSLPLQGASALASEDRYAGAKHASRNPCYTSNTGLFFPFSARHKLQSLKRKRNVKTNIKTNIKTAQPPRPLRLCGKSRCCLTEQPNLYDQINSKTRTL
jgi:hypothetical protein